MGVVLLIQNRNFQYWMSWQIVYDAVHSTSPRYPPAPAYTAIIIMNPVSLALQGCDQHGTVSKAFL